MTRVCPSASQRRADVPIRSGTIPAGAMARAASEKAMSSSADHVGKPPTSSNNARVAQIPMSPVHEPPRRARAVIHRPAQRKRGSEDRTRTWKHPHRCVREAWAMAEPLPGGTSESAWTNQRMSPDDAATPAFNCGPRPPEASTRETPAARATSTLPSALPPSTTTTSSTSPRNRANNAGNAAASFNTGTIAEIK